MMGGSVRLIWMVILLAACQDGSRGVGAAGTSRPPKEGTMEECKGVRIRVGTVAWIGEYRVGVEGFSGEAGDWKARLVFVDPKATEDAPVWEGEVGSGQSFDVGRHRFRVVEVRRLPSPSELPGSDPSFVCIEVL